MTFTVLSTARSLSTCDTLILGLQLLPCPAPTSLTGARLSLRSVESRKEMGIFRVEVRR